MGGNFLPEPPNLEKNTCIFCKNMFIEEQLEKHKKAQRKQPFIISPFRKKTLEAFCVHL